MLVLRMAHRKWKEQHTLLQKQKEVRFEFPATIPVPYEPPGSGLSGNINFKKIYREVYFYCSSYSKI